MDQILRVISNPDWNPVMYTPVFDKKLLIIISIMYKTTDLDTKTILPLYESQIKASCNICYCGSGNTAYQILDIIGTVWLWFVKYRKHLEKCKVLNCLFHHYKSTRIMKLKTCRAEFYFNLYMLSKFLSRCVQTEFKEDIMDRMVGHVYSNLKLLCSNSGKFITPWSIYGEDVENHELMFQMLDSNRFGYLDHGGSIFSSWISSDGIEAVKLGKDMLKNRLQIVN